MGPTPLENYELSISAEQIEEGLSNLCPKIDAWISKISDDYNQSVIAICILRGGVFFYADLLRRINHSVQVEFVQFSSYDESKNEQKSDSDLEEFHLPFDYTDRAVLLVDDICESGRTLRLLAKKLMETGAREVKSAVMVHRHMPTAQTAPDFYASEIHHADWLVGMGLDDRGHFRNLPSIFKIKQDG